MKTTILLLLLITFSAHGQNETAFTLAKQLAKYEYKAKPTPKDREEASKLLGQLLYYTQCDRYGATTDFKLEPYQTLYNRYSRLRNTYFFLDSLQLSTLAKSGKIKTLRQSITPKTEAKIRMDIDLLDQLINYSDEFVQTEQKVHNLSNELTNIKSDSTKLSAILDTILVPISIINSEKIKTYPGLFPGSPTASLIKDKLEKLKKIIPMEIDELKKKQDSLLFRIDDDLRKLSSETCLSLFNQKLPSPTTQYLYQELNKDIKKIFDDKSPIQLNIIGSDRTTGSISFKMPSESDLIKAAGAYLAKRVKQESVLWFFDEMRENAEAYSLLSTAFPETIKLLQSEEIYHTPNLSVTWHSALSKDFVKMPKNVLDSDWLKEKLRDKHELANVYLSTGWDIAQYVDQKFSYREIIRQLYLNKNDSLDDSVHITPNTLIDILYAFSTELYISEDAKTFRTISYEELRSLTAEEMDIMLSLLDMKYNRSIQIICGFKLFNGKNALSRENANKISAWIGRFNFALGQFDKVLQEVTDKEKDQTSNFSYYNVWNLMSQALMELLPKEAIDTDKAHYKETQFYIGLLNDSYEVYEMLSKRNYAGSVSKIINLVDQLIYEDSVKFTYPITTSKDIIFNKGEFKETSTIFELSKNILASHLAKRGIKPRKIHRALKNYPDFIPFNKIPPSPASTGSTCIFNITTLDAIKKKNKKLKKIVEKAEENTSIAPAVQILKKNPADWGGTKYKLNEKDSVLSFPINSIGAMVLTSKYRKSQQMIRKLASFLNDVALSKDEEMLVKVVESYALPPGSYKQKRNSWFSVDLNAFVGAYVGYETASRSQLRSIPDSVRNELKNGLVYGVSAPIGVSFTKTFGKRLFGTSEITSTQRNNPDLVKIGKSKIKSLSGCSFTTTVTILDLGAIVSYRFTNTDSVAQQSFKWSQFVSPGLHFAISIRNTPLVVMTGIQYTPQLRRVKPITESPLNMTRLYAGIYFDLPLYNMYTKRRVYKL